MAKYVKTVPIEAEQFDGWMKTAEKYHIRIDPADDLSGVVDELVPRGHYYLMTLEGELPIHQGDWIATGVNGEHWAIKEDVFKRTYRLENDEKVVSVKARWIECYGTLVNMNHIVTLTDSGKGNVIFDMDNGSQFTVNGDYSKLVEALNK